MKKESLIENANTVGDYLIEKLNNIEEVVELRGRGLMLGLKFPFAVKSLRDDLVHNQKIFTGSASDPNVLRLLPPLTLTNADADIFIQKLILSLNKIKNNEAVSISK